jgi:hypothetical protein
VVDVWNDVPIFDHLARRSLEIQLAAGREQDTVRRPQLERAKGGEVAASRTHPVSLAIADAKGALYFLRHEPTSDLFGTARWCEGHPAEHSAGARLVLVSVSVEREVEAPELRVLTEAKGSARVAR